MSHSVQRMRERAPQFMHLLPELQKLAATGKRYAVCLGSAPGMVGCRFVGSRNTSHGNQTWAIIGDGKVITVMYRRSTQPKTPEAFDVDEVLLWA